MKDSDNIRELKRGIEVEKEHKNTYEWLMQYVMDNEEFPSLDQFAESIADDHLKEEKDYYSKLDKAGL